LPKDVALPEDIEVTVVRSGDILTIYPKRRMSIAEMLRRLGELPAPDDIEVRDPDVVPDRPGL
jgi:antitoxin VapB